MKLKTVLVAALAGGAGYVLGARAGRERYDAIRARVGDVVHSPQAQDAADKLATEVRKSADKLPDPVADIVTHAADAVSEAPKTDTSGATAS